MTNTAHEPVTLHLQGRTPNADFRIFDSNGETVWSRLRGQTLLGVLRLHPLDAGDELVFREVWNARGDTGRPVPAGDYLICGVLMTDDPKEWTSPAARLVIDR